jgi:hypothetical protein
VRKSLHGGIPEGLEESIFISCLAQMIIFNLYPRQLPLFICQRRPFDYPNSDVWFEGCITMHRIDLQDGQDAPMGNG